MGRIFGIMGQARAGKDTIAQYLVSEHQCIRIGLADPMKRFCKEVFKFTDEQLWGNKKEQEDPRYPHSRHWNNQFGDEVVEYLTPRYALQTLGTEWGRRCYNDLWIDYGIRVAKELLNTEEKYERYGYLPEIGLFTAVYKEDVWPAPTGVVFSDLRFLNEFNAVKNANGVLVRVIRPGTDGDVGISGHVSEMEQKTLPDSAFDFVIQNDGTIQQLYENVERLLAPLLEN